MKKQIQIKILPALVAILFLIIFLSCSHNPVGVSSLATICFESQVLPIFQTNCAIAGCHEGERGKGGYVFDSYSTIMKAVTPNEPKKSKAYQYIVNTWIHFMPPSPHQPLSSEQRTLIAVWIEQGANDTSCP